MRAGAAHAVRAPGRAEASGRVCCMMEQGHEREKFVFNFDENYANYTLGWIAGVYKLEGKWI